MPLKAKHPGHQSTPVPPAKIPHGPADHVAAPIQEGYQPTSFENVQPQKTVRPLSGRFPTKRRR